MTPRRPATLDPEIVAIKALEFLAADPERLSRFLALTGLGPASLRRAAREPRFLASILDHLAGDDGLLTAFAAAMGWQPEAVAAACARLGAGASGET